MSDLRIEKDWLVSAENYLINLKINEGSNIRKVWRIT